MDIKNLVFPDDGDIKEFWTSGMGRWILWHDEWFPFMQKVSLHDARKILSCPDEKQMKLREQFVQEAVGTSEQDVDEDKLKSNPMQFAKDLLHKVHEQTQNTENFVKLYKIKGLKDIPGSGQDTGTELKPARLEIFRKATSDYPFLFKFQFQAVTRQR